MNLVGEEFLHIRSRCRPEYEVFIRLEMLQRRLDDFRTEVCGCVGFIPSPVELVLCRDMPGTLWVLDPSAIRALYEKYEGSPPIIFHSRSAQ